MRVNIKDKSKQKGNVAEMYSGASGEMGLVFEMITDPAKLSDLVPIDGITEKAASIAQAAKDDSPEFPVVRVEEGWSESGRLWPAAELDSIVKQTNELEPVGHLGHIPDDQASTAFPDVQTTWLGAIAKTEPSKQKNRVGEMVKVAYFAGYNHKGAKIRSLLPARAVRGISWWGRAHQKPIPGRGVEMSGFELKAIDWARKLSEGMPTSRVVAIASEMEGDKMDKDLSQVTPAEFKEHNPNAHALIVQEAQEEQKATIGEMEEKLTKAEEQEQLLQQITKALKVDDPSKALDAIGSLMTKLGDKAKQTVEKLVGDVLTEKVKDENTRKLVAGLIAQPVAEMESKVEELPDEEAAKKFVGEQIDAIFNENELVKQVVGEQSPPIVRRREELRGGAGDKDNPYIPERERVTLG